MGDQRNIRRLFKSPMARRERWLQSYTSSINNALEATNRVIKDDNTLRVDLPLTRLNGVIF